MLRSIFFLFVLLLGACASTGESPSLDNIPSLFDDTPIKAEQLISAEALIALKQKYEKSQNNKAIAQSQSGAWGFTVNQDSELKASEEALTWCQKYNKRHESLFPCHVINLNGQWLSGNNKAIKIVTTLPDWQPTEPIDLDQIRDSARQDKENKHYALALKKELWYFQNALSIEPAQVGVRLSFALSQWHDLANVYPPAKTLLHYAAYNLQQDIKQSEQPAFNAISEYVAISDKLGRADNTVSLFKWLDAHQPAQIKYSRRMFEPAMLVQKEYTLLAKYINPDLDYATHLTSYLASLEYEKSKADFDENESFATNNFIYSIAKMVALLVKDERKSGAHKLIKRAKIDIQNNKLDSAIKLALQGNIPEPLY